MDFVRSLDWLVNPRSAQPFSLQDRDLEITLVNLSGCEVRLPGNYAHVERGELSLAPTIFDQLKVLTHGECGTFIFSGAGFSAAVELLLETDEATSSRRLFLSAAGALLGPPRISVQWGEGCGGEAAVLRHFHQEMPPLPLQAPRIANQSSEGLALTGDGHELPVATEGLCAWVSRPTQTGNTLALRVTIHCHDDVSPMPSAPMSTLQEPAIVSTDCSNSATLRQPHIGVLPDPFCKTAENSRATSSHLPLSRSSSAANVVHSGRKLVANFANLATSFKSPASVVPKPWMPLASRRKWLLITVVNYAGVGFTFPPDFGAGMAAGEVWKEKAYVAPNESGLLAFGDDVHFSGSAFCRLGDGSEFLYFEAANPLVGASRFNVYFGTARRMAAGADVKAEHRAAYARRSPAVHYDPQPSGPGSLADWAVTSLSGVLNGGQQLIRDQLARHSHDEFLGVAGDATVHGEGFEALITDARDGQDAIATVAVYSRVSRGSIPTVSASQLFAGVEDGADTEDVVFARAEDDVLSNELGS